MRVNVVYTLDGEKKFGCVDISIVEKGKAVKELRKRHETGEIEILRLRQTNNGKEGKLE